MKEEQINFISPKIRNGGFKQFKLGQYVIRRIAKTDKADSIITALRLAFSRVHKPNSYVLVRYELDHDSNRLISNVVAIADSKRNVRKMIICRNLRPVDCKQKNRRQTAMTFKRWALMQTYRKNELRKLKREKLDQEQNNSGNYCQQ
ncbi:TPA: hypothetical protein ACX6RX_003156 [Photobacterium damselae]